VLPAGVELTTTWNCPGLAGLIWTTGGLVDGVVVIVQAPRSATGTEHDNAADPVKAADELISSKYVADWPAVIGSTTGWLGVEAMQKSDAVPLSGMPWGLPGALSFRVSVALLDPPFAPQVADCNGLNATWIVHVEPGATLCPVQPSPPLAITKSPAFGPVRDRDVIINVPANGPELLFVTVMGWGASPAPPASWLPKLTLVGTEMPAWVAVPVNATVGGLPPGTLSVAERIPGAVAAGVKVTLIWQLIPAGTGFGMHEAGEEKSPAFGPEIATPLISALAPPLFRIVTFCGALAVPSLW
jgi:hypothetical protein